MRNDFSQGFKLDEQRSNLLLSLSSDITLLPGSAWKCPGGGSASSDGTRRQSLQNGIAVKKTRHLRPVKPDDVNRCRDLLKLLSCAWMHQKRAKYEVLSAIRTATVGQACN
jgi:hypothetical protein